MKSVLVRAKIQAARFAVLRRERGSAGRQDMHLGVSDPRKPGPGPRSGGWQRGSLTPQMPPSPALTAAPTATRAAKKRRPLDRGEVADRKQHRHFTSVTQSRCSAAS